ncbi:hypothetical protein J7J39_00225 [bacterium]|nr:hypothetical protein [bacterium]
MKDNTSEIINIKEIKQAFNEFVRENHIKQPQKKNFEAFLRFLEIDFYDWIRENLRSYFRKE